MLSMTELNNKRAFTIAEAAKYACVSRATLLNWIVSRLLPYEELPGRGKGSHKFRLIRKNDLDAFLNTHYYRKNTSHKNGYSQELILFEKEA